MTTNGLCVYFDIILLASLLLVASSMAIELALELVVASMLLFLDEDDADDADDNITVIINQCGSVLGDDIAAHSGNNE